MPFCINCGNNVSEEANFCPQCGKKIIIEPKQELKQEEIIPPPEESILTPKRKHAIHGVDNTFTLLDPGSIFNNDYRIEKVLGHDNDGITYLAIDERCKEQRSLKLFYQSYFDNVDKLFGSLIRMSKIKSVSHPNVAKVYEVNQSFKPSYIVSEYVEGTTLAELKETRPERLSEEKARDIAKQIVEAATVIRKADLAVRNLSLNSIILTDDGKARVLPSGVNYDVDDVREDIFSVGIVLAKLFSTSTFYETIYVPLKLREKKFEYISGITKDTNEVIAGCLHRNINQRYSSFEELTKDLKQLGKISPDRIYVAADTDIPKFVDDNDLAYPINRLDKYFWIILVAVIGFIAILMTTNLLDTVFGQQKTSIKFTGFLPDVTDTTESFNAITADNYRNIRYSPSSPRSRISPKQTAHPPESKQINPNVTIPPPQPIFTQTQPFENETTIKERTPLIKKAVIPDEFILISGGVYAFGSLRKDAKENVSLNSFYILRTEVTQEEWNKYMKPANCSTVGSNLPVDNVSWFDVIQYCNARSEAEGLTPCYNIVGSGATKIVSCNFKATGYRLPTEAEWEYAARSGRLYDYSGSNDPDMVGWFRANSGNRIRPVASKKANALGLYDMTGNVSEWCWDWYDANYPKSMPFINPTGPEFGNIKVIRGGSISSADGNELKVINRFRATPTKSMPYVGFRIVRSR